MRDLWDTWRGGLAPIHPAGWPFVLGGAVAASMSPRAVYALAGIGALAALAWATATLRNADWSRPNAVLTG